MAVFVTKTANNPSASNLRPNGSTRGSRDNVLRDEDEEKEETLSQGVVVYVTNSAGLILTISKDSHGEDVNLPGGSVEEGEELEEAAKRELLEETGITALDLAPVYTAQQGGKTVTVFHVFEFTGKVRSSNEGEAGWSSSEEVEVSHYGQFFKDMLKSMT